MENFLNLYRHKTKFGNWDWQSQMLKQQFGQLTLSDVTFEIGKENDMLTRIGTRLKKSRNQVICIIKNLKPY